MSVSQRIGRVGLIPSSALLICGLTVPHTSISLISTGSIRGVLDLVLLLQDIRVGVFLGWVFCSHTSNTHEHKSPACTQNSRLSSSSCGEWVLTRFVIPVILVLTRHGTLIWIHIGV